MTMADAMDLLGTWEQEPPAFVLLARIEAMIAAWLGARRTAPTMPDGLRQETADAFKELHEAFGEPLPAMPAENSGLVYDFDKLKARHGR